MSESPGGVTRAYVKSFVSVARWLLGYTLVLMAAASLTEGIGVALLFPALQLAGVDIGVRSEAARFAEWIEASFAALGLRPTLVLMLGLFVAIVSVRATLSLAQGMATTVLHERFTQHLRQWLFEAISGADWMFICKSRSSDFVHALTNEVDRAGSAASQGLLVLSGAAVTALYLGFSLILFPGTTLLMIAVCALLALVTSAWTYAVHRAGEEFSANYNMVYVAAIEYFQGLKTAKMYGAQERTCELFSRLSRDLAASSITVVRGELFADAWFEVGAAITLGAVLLAAIRLFAISAAEVLILLFLFARVVPRIRSLQSGYRGLVGTLPGFATVTKLADQCLEAAEPKVHAPKSMEFRSAVRLENISFTYPGAQASVVRGLDLVIPAGRTTAIVGPSGAGKSTIADLLMGLMPPDDGRITVDGFALDQRHSRSWRETIGYVAQDTFLFHDTVRANLLWARPDASESELREVLKTAAADEFVARLPRGLDTVVGDRGATLSQGERQRLALARALLRRPELLVLDEATNSLDSENETKILGALERIHGGITTVLIAHRLSTIRWADLIYVIEDGRAVESGDWTSLAGKLDGRFRSWCLAQGLAA